MQRLAWMLVLATVGGCEPLMRHVIMPEQRTITYREPAAGQAFESDGQVQKPEVPGDGNRAQAPRTVADRRKVEEWKLSLDDAIQIGLENAKVIRVLTGITATASGRTIYDPAITNTTIDQERGRFDPVFSHQTSFNQTDTAFPIINPFDPTQALILGTKDVNYKGVTSLNQTNAMGGQLAANWSENPSRFSGSAGPFPLNPQNANSLTLSYTQPLLQGAGVKFNTAPIVIARLNTEASFFQYKDSVQELVRGIIEGYWSLVQARIEVWAKKIQVDQSQEAYDREKARLEARLADVKDVAQARVTYTQFKASLVAAEAAVLAREGALRNLLGLPADDDRQIVPTSAPTFRRMKHQWNDLVSLANERRPDIIELKLIIEAEQVRLLQAKNQTLPKVDAVALYRWNGLAGAMPNGERMATGPGQYTDWTIGVNFSVPLGLRQGRAKVREETLLLIRDRANLEQGLHAARHELAVSVRELDNTFEQYLAFRDARLAAFDNLKVQIEQFKAGRSIYLNVLQALNDWGSAVTSEAKALLSYNVTLGTLERQTGTILETHGLVFYEERFRAAGPLLRSKDYPSALPPVSSGESGATATGVRHYPATKASSEESFDLRNPTPRGPSFDKRPVFGPPSVVPGN